MTSKGEDERQHQNEQQYDAIWYAVEFLAGVVARYRIAAAEAGRTDTRNDGVEKMIADAFSFVPSARDLKTWMDIAKRGEPTTSEERIAMGKCERALQALQGIVGADPSQPLTSDQLENVTAEKARAIADAIPKAWRERRAVAIYAGQETALLGLRTSTPTLGELSRLNGRLGRLARIRKGLDRTHHRRFRDALGKGVDGEIAQIESAIAEALGRLELEQANRRDLDRELAALLDRQHSLQEQALAALFSGSEVDQQQRDDLTRVEAALVEKRAELARLDGSPLFSNVTEVRRALSERTAGELARADRARSEIEKLTQELTVTGGTAGRRRLREKIAQLKEELQRLQPGPWKPLGSKAKVMKLAKRAGLTTRDKPPRPKPNS